MTIDQATAGDIIRTNSGRVLRVASVSVLSNGYVRIITKGGARHQFRADQTIEREA